MKRLRPNSMHRLDIFLQGVEKTKENIGQHIQF
jgi:hypothetical protein